MQAFMLNEMMEYEFDHNIGIFSSFEAAMQKVLDVLNSSVERPDRVDMMQGNDAIEFHRGYVHYIIREKQIDGDGNVVNVWCIDDDSILQFSYGVEFRENGGHFTMDWLQSTIAKGMRI